MPPCVNTFMGKLRDVKPLRLALLGSLAAVALAVVSLVAPIAAFHLLPPQATGESARLAEVLAIGPGSVVADIGAGSGSFAAALARLVEPGGRVYATELSSRRLRDIQRRVEREGLANLSVVEAGETETRLPEACCDAVFMRNVYHHIEDPALFNRSLNRTVKPGGRLAIIDFPPDSFRVLARSDASRTREGHGIAPGTVVEEMTRAGFELEREIENWGGRMFLLLFRRVSGSGS